MNKLSKMLEYDQCCGKAKKDKVRGMKRWFSALKRVVRLGLMEKVLFGQR